PRDEREDRGALRRTRAGRDPEADPDERPRERRRHREAPRDDREERAVSLAEQRVRKQREEEEHGERSDDDEEPRRDAAEEPVAPPHGLREEQLEEAALPGADDGLARRDERDERHCEDDRVRRIEHDAREPGEAEHRALTEAEPHEQPEDERVDHAREDDPS